MATVSQKTVRNLYVLNHGVIKRTLEIEYRYTGYFSHYFKWNAQKILHLCQRKS